MWLQRETFYMFFYLGMVPSFAFFLEVLLLFFKIAPGGFSFVSWEERPLLLCGHPGQQQGLRFPIVKLSIINFILLSLVSNFLADKIQQVYSFRCKGVSDFQIKLTSGENNSRISFGNMCIMMIRPWNRSCPYFSRIHKPVCTSLTVKENRWTSSWVISLML